MRGCSIPFICPPFCTQSTERTGECVFTRISHLREIWMFATICAVNCIYAKIWVAFNIIICVPQYAQIVSFWLWGRLYVCACVYLYVPDFLNSVWDADTNSLRVVLYFPSSSSTTSIAHHIVGHPFPGYDVSCGETQNVTKTTARGIIQPNTAIHTHAHTISIDVHVNWCARAAYVLDTGVVVVVIVIIAVIIAEPRCGIVWVYVVRGSACVCIKRSLAIAKAGIWNAPVLIRRWVNTDGSNV